MILDIKERINQQSQSYLQSIKRKLNSGAESPRTREIYQDIKHNQDQCKYLADEKLDIIDQIDKVIDSHLLQLDKHIARFQNELRESGAKPKLMYDEPATETQSIGLPGKRKPPKFERDTLPLKRHKRTTEDACIVKIDPSMGSGMPEGPIGGQQAIYCKCQKQLYDEMVACDNPRCKYKWFHFSCVGLKAAPNEDEKWYCTDCALKLQNKHK